MTKLAKCPCTDCICKPACKHKLFLDLIMECSIINAYTEHPADKDLEIDAMMELEDVLQSTKWRYRNDTCATGTVIRYETT